MNKSSIYGYYGGVSNSNHYIPTTQPFVPQPSQPHQITEQDRLLLHQLVLQTEFYSQNAPNILLRTNTVHTSANVDTFVIHTSANPEDVIVYTSETDTFELGILNGGAF